MDNLQKIQSKIYVIRGQRVMFDFDLASIYEVETKILNQSVKRNFKRFEGEEFMFHLTPEEWKNFTKQESTMPDISNVPHSFSDDYNLRSQFVTSRFSNNWGGSRRPPYAFTEIGVAMLSSVLKSEVAIQANRKIRYVRGLSRDITPIETLVIATHGFIKKTQKTPQKEIDKAIKIRNTYFETK